MIVELCDGLKRPKIGHPNRSSTRCLLVLGGLLLKKFHCVQFGLNTRHQWRTAEH